MKNAKAAEIILHRIQAEESLNDDAVNLSTLEISALKKAYCALIEVCDQRPDCDFIK